MDEIRIGDRVLAILQGDRRGGGVSLRRWCFRAPDPPPGPRTDVLDTLAGLAIGFVAGTVNSRTPSEDS